MICYVFTFGSIPRQIGKIHNLYSKNGIFNNCANKYFLVNIASITELLLAS